MRGRALSAVNGILAKLEAAAKTTQVARQAVKEVS